MRQGIFLLLSLGILSPAYAQLHSLPNMPDFLPVKAVTIDAPLLENQPAAVLSSQTTLSLREAVYLGLKHNTDLLTSLNNRQLQRFDLLEAKAAFQPKFNFSNSLSYNKTESTGSPNTISRHLSLNPSVDWKFPLGTQLSLSDTLSPSNLTGGSSSGRTFSNEYKISVTQPLLKNFGVKVNEVDLDNAYDQQAIDDLNLRKKVQSTLSKIATDYYAVVSAKQSHDVAKQSLTEAEKQVTSRKARLKAGQIPSTDVTQASINLIGSQQSLDQADQSLETAKANLLNDLGLPPNTEFEVADKLAADEVDANMTKSLKQALENNVDLKIEKLSSRQDKRKILTSQNERRWDLSLQASRSRSRSLNTYNVGNDTTQTSDNTSVSLNLTIDLDRLKLDKDELSSAINLENQQISEAQQKRTIVNNIIAAVHNLKSAWSQYQVSKQKLILSEQSERAAKIKYQFGKIDAFTYQQQEDALVSAQNNVITERIAYLKQLMSYRTLEGTLLSHWNIHVEAKHDVKK